MPKNICMRIFFAPLFTLAKNWKLCKCATIGSLLYQLQCKKYDVIYWAVIKLMMYIVL